MGPMPPSIFLLALLLPSAAAAPPPFCRCLPSDPCWAAIPWATLNASVSGRLAVSVDPLAICATAPASVPCDAALNASDDEFFLTAQPNGYLHTGLFHSWNTSQTLSAFSVLAETVADVQAAVAFAATHSLRLAVKNTGHDWFTRSSAPGSLLLWTHQLKKLTFAPTFSTGCPGAPAVGAAILGAGVQFDQLYPAAQELGLVVIGGTCDSVGAAGCWLGGCYGTMSRMYGAGAANLLQAKVVLADGSLVTASECENAELFWSLRGGGGGGSGVVVEFVARTHRAPATMLLGGGGYTAKDKEGWQQLLEMQLNYTLQVMAPPWGGGVGWSGGGGGGGGSVSFWPRGFEMPIAAGQALLAPFDALVKAQPSRFSGSGSWSVWNASSWKRGQTLPWMEVHPDREISTALLASFSRYPVVRQFDTAEGAARVASAIINFTLLMPGGVRGIAGGIDFEKSQFGASPAALSLLAQTSVNPAVAISSGLLLIMYNVPSLPTVPPSAPLLKRLWPRLQQYLALNENDPLVATCEAGAQGSDADAVACLTEWREVRAPPIQAQLKAAKEAMRAAFPDIDEEGVTLSGTYINEGVRFCVLVARVLLLLPTACVAYVGAFASLTCTCPPARLIFHSCRTTTRSIGSARSGAMQCTPGCAQSRRNLTPVGCFIVTTAWAARTGIRRGTAS